MSGRLRHRTGDVLFVGLVVLTTFFLFSPMARADHHPATTAEDVEVIQRGGTVMYRYRNTDGRQVVVDRPPPFYFNTSAESTPDAAPEEPARTAQPAVAAPRPAVRTPQRPAWWRFAWVLPVGLLLAALFAWLWPLLRRWRHESLLDRALRKEGLPVFEDVRVSADGRRYVMVDRIARTASGILVVAVADLSGEIRGELHADHWIQGNQPVLNPLKRMRQAGAAVAHLSLTIPVHCRLVVSGKPSFSMTVPTYLQSPAQFADALPELAQPAAPERDLDGAWRTLMRLPRSNKGTLRPAGPGPIGWVRRHPAETRALAFCAAAVIVSVALLLVPAV